MMHRCAYILDEYDRIAEERERCRRFAMHYYQPWRQWFCGSHRRYLSGLRGIRRHGWKKRFV